MNFNYDTKIPVRKVKGITVKSGYFTKKFRLAVFVLQKPGQIQIVL
jgi:hypothetical protein